MFHVQNQGHPQSQLFPSAHWRSFAVGAGVVVETRAGPVAGVPAKPCLGAGTVAATIYAARVFVLTSEQETWQPADSASYIRTGFRTHH